MPNTSYITNSFDGNARLLSTTLKNSSHSTLNSHQYTYNSANQRIQQSFNSGSTYDYTYDAIGQLKMADSGTASEDRGYTYDTAWNLNYRTNNNGTLNTFSVDALNQLTNSTPGGVSTYDGNGNLISRGGGLLELTYDDENRLSTVQSNLVVYGTNYGLWKTLYAYDGKGRLRRRVELQVLTIPAEPPPDIDLFGGLESMESEGGGSHPWGTNSITHYIYDDWRVIQERNGSNNVPTVSYTRGTDLSGTLEGAGGIGGLLARSHGYSSGNWSTHNYYHADGNGNVTYLVAANQGQAAKYRYDPYGNAISVTENLGFLGTPNTYRFSSKMADLKSGHYYYGYRWYEPNFQRWLNQDPIAERGGINLYSFVLNAPANHVDSFGLVVCFDAADCAAQCKCAAVDLSKCIKRQLGYECDCSTACITPPPPPPTNPPPTNPPPTNPPPDQPPPPTSPGKTFEMYVSNCRLVCHCPNGDSVIDAAFSSDGCTCNYVGGSQSKGGFGKICGCRWGKYQEHRTSHETCFDDYAERAVNSL